MCRTSARFLPRLGTQRPVHRLGFSIDHHQQSAGWSRGTPAPLLPVLYGALIYPKVLGKLFLRHLDFLTNGPDIECRRDMDPILASVCLSGGVRQGLTRAGEYPAAGFRHSV